MNTPIVTIEEYKPRFNKLLDVSTIISAILWILGFISMLPFVKFATHSVFNYDDYYSFISNKLYIEIEGWYPEKWKKRTYTRHKPFDQFEFLSLIKSHSLIEQWNGNI